MLSAWWFMQWVKQTTVVKFPSFILLWQHWLEFQKQWFQLPIPARTNVGWFMFWASLAYCQHRDGCQSSSDKVLTFSGNLLAFTHILSSSFHLHTLPTFPPIFFFQVVNWTSLSGASFVKKDNLWGVKHWNKQVWWKSACAFFLSFRLWYRSSVTKLRYSWHYHLGKTAVLWSF